MREIDFLPDRIRAARARRRRWVIHGYLLGAAALVLAAGAYWFQHRLDDARTELAAIQVRGEAMGRQLQLRQELETGLSDLMIKKRIEEQLGRRVGTLDVLAELQRVMPESMALTNLTMETVEVTVPVKPAEARGGDRAMPAEAPAAQQTLKRVRLVLTGMAPTDVDVANFIGQLASSPVFEDVNMGYAKNVTFRQRAARAFQASCYVTR